MHTRFRVLLYTGAILAVAFEGVVLYDVYQHPYYAVQPCNCSTHAKNIPATPDPLYSALNKDIVISGRKESSIVWQQAFDKPTRFISGETIK
jgi:hypothetical protein